MRLKWVLIFVGLWLFVSATIDPGVGSLILAVGFYAAIAVSVARRFAPPVKEQPTFLPRQTGRADPWVKAAAAPKPQPFRMLSPIRSLLSRLHPKAYAYFRAVLGFMIALGVMFAFRSGVQAQTGTMATLNIMVPTLVMAIMLSPVLVPVISAVATYLSGFGIKRGYLDVLVGVVLTAVYWVPSLVSDLQHGGAALAMSIGFVCAGAFAGFEFWRAEGYPGARRTVAQWLNGLRNGFLQGLGR